MGLSPGERARKRTRRNSRWLRKRKEVVNRGEENNVTILEGGEFVWGFPTKCGGINRGEVTEVDPDTRGQENPISTCTDQSIGITFCVWTIIPGWPLLYETPLGMICLYGK